MYLISKRPRLTCFYDNVCVFLELQRKGSYNLIFIWTWRVLSIRPNPAFKIFSIPDFDVPFPVTGTGMTNSNPIFGNGNGNENSIKFHSLFREREWEWKIPFPTFGTGIGGRYSREFPGSGIPAHGCCEPLCIVHCVPLCTIVCYCLGWKGHLK